MPTKALEIFKDFEMLKICEPFHNFLDNIVMCKTTVSFSYITKILVQFSLIFDIICVFKNVNV